MDDSNHRRQFWSASHCLLACLLLFAGCPDGASTPPAARSDGGEDRWTDTAADRDITEGDDANEAVDAGAEGFDMTDPATDSPADPDVLLDLPVDPLEPDGEPSDTPLDLGPNTLDAPDLQRTMWCATQWPHVTSTTIGVPSEVLYTQLRIEGVTPTGGSDPQLTVELGWGPPSALPNTADWRWTAAEFNPYCAYCGDNEEYMGTLTPDDVGEFRWAARVTYATDGPLYCDRADGGRAGSDDGWSPDDAPTLLVFGPGPVTIVTLNLRCLIDDWDERLAIIADTLADLSPDLMGFQEVCAESDGRDNLVELVAALSTRTGVEYHFGRAVTHWSWERYDEGIALVTPHRILDSTVQALPAGVFPRKVLMAHIFTPQGIALFATTHLDYQSTEVRGEQIAAAISALEDQRIEGQPTILTGDLNEAPGGTIEEALEAADFVDLWATLHPGDGGPTFPADSPHSRIDYVWLDSNSSDFAPDSIERILGTAVGGIYGSDHLGLYATIAR